MSTKDLSLQEVKWQALMIFFDQDMMLVTISIITCNCVVKICGGR
jgi:hypothetical protein